MQIKFCIISIDRKTKLKHVFAKKKIKMAVISKQPRIVNYYMGNFLLEVNFSINPVEFGLSMTYWTSSINTALKHSLSRLGRCILSLCIFDWETVQTRMLHTSSPSLTTASRVLMLTFVYFR